MSYDGDEAKGFGEAFADPTRHGRTVLLNNVPVSSQALDRLKLLGEEWEIQFGHKWTVTMIVRRILEEFALNDQRMNTLIHVPGQMPGPQRELLAVLAKKYGLR